MSRIHPNDKFAKDMYKELSASLNIPYEVVESVINGMSYYIINEVARLGDKAKENGNIRNKFTIEVPMIGKLTLFPKKYPKTEKSILDGWALRSEFTIRENYLAKLRMAYYTGEDYMTEFIEKNFNQMLIDKYSVILRGEDEEVDSNVK